MGPRIVRIILIWNAVLTVVLLVSLAFNAAMALAASDPPVKVYTVSQNDLGGDFASKTAGTSLNSGSYVNLLSTSVTLSSSSTCIVMASTQANAAGNASTHNIGLSVDTTSSIVTGSNREIYFPTTVGVSEVTTVYGFNNLNGTHTFYLLGTGTPAMTIGIRSMTVACFSKRL